MSVEVITVKSNCFLWKNIHLPHSGKTFTSPVFSFEGINWQFDVNCYWQYNNEHFTFSVVQPPEYSDSYCIIPYIESMGKYVLMPKSLSRTEMSSDRYKIVSDTITMLLVSLTNSMSIPLDLVSVKVAEESYSDQPSIQTLSLEGLSKDIVQLFNDDAYSDVTLKCGDRSFKVHRIILGARSEVFTAMFKHDMSEKNSGIVNIEDMDPNILEYFLRYLYSSSVEEMSIDVAVELYKAANKYAVSTLRKLCSSYIIDNLTDDIICKALIISDEADDMEFFNSIASLAAKNGGFLKSPEWKDFAKKFSKIAVNVYFMCSN